MHEDTERPVSIIFSPCQPYTVHSLRTIWQCYLVPHRLNTSLLYEIHELKRSYRRFFEDLGEKVTLSHISLGKLIKPHGTAKKPGSRLVGLLTTSSSLKGCSIAAIVHKDCVVVVV